MKTLFSVAKINLFLKIQSVIQHGNFKGYHELYTLFYPLKNIADQIFITKGNFKIICNHPKVPVNEKNLVFKAVKIFERESKMKVDLKFDIDKKIPVAGGMAGGSSNAGTIIRFLNQYYETKFPLKKLIEICTEIGADVSFFLNPQMTLASSIGNKFNVIPKIKFSLPILIFTFDFGISAKWAYEKFSQKKIQKNRRKFCQKEIIQILQTNEPKEITKIIDNDLSFEIFNHYSSLKHLKKILENNNALKIEISGSGPSLFAVFENRQQRDLAKKNIDKSLYQNVYQVDL